MTDHWLGPRAVSLRSNLPSLPDLPISYSRASSPLQSGSWHKHGWLWAPLRTANPTALQGTTNGGAGSQRGFPAEQQLGCADNSPPDLPTREELRGTRKRELGAPLEGRLM